MIKVDMRDRKILYQLDLDSRQSANQIGRKVGLSSGVVSYRINRLKETGIINNFYTLIDAMSIGFFPIRLHIKLQYITSKIIKEIIDYFVKNKYSALVASTDGIFDLSITIWVKDIHDFYDLLQEVKSKYGYYFQNYFPSFFIKELRFRQSYLMLNNYSNSDRNDYLLIGKRKIEEIDQLDLEILRFISSNATVPLTKIGKMFNFTAEAIKYRIKRLIEKGVILGFKIDIDVTKMGYQKFKTNIQLRNYSQRKQIIDYIQHNSKLTNIDINTGESDLELEFVLENIKQLHEIMYEIMDRFPNSIKNYDIITLMKSHKFLFFPEHHDIASDKKESILK